MTGTAQRETPNVGIFWLAQTTDGEARLLASGCPLDQAELYGDCLTYGPGRYETWAEWRGDRTVDPALRAIVRSYEYEDWPRGRIFFDRARDLFVLYADRKLMTPEMIAHIETQFYLPAERTEIDRLTMKDLRRDLAAAEAGAAGDVEFLFLSIKRRLRDRDAIRREAIAKYVRVRAKARDFRSV